MPELPEVETVCLALSKVTKGFKIKQIKIYRKDLRWEVKDTIEETIENDVFKAPYRRGKYILIPTRMDNILLIHLGMSGQIRIEEKESVILKHDHMRFIVENNQNKIFVITYNDPRRFGYIDLFNKIDFKNHFLLAKIGVEPLSKELTVEYLKNTFHNKFKNIKNALLDQRIIAGIGNIYASEILFRAKINPHRSVNTLNQNDLKLIIKASKMILKKAIKVGGTTIRDHVQPDGNLGYFKQELKVYGRANKNCNRCNSLIKVRTITNRSTFFCENCQV